LKRSKVHQILFVGSHDAVAELELDESPAERFPCMSSHQYHREARSQLYALVTQCFSDEAYDLEVMHREMQDDGPYLYELTESTVTALASIEEEEATDLAKLWGECAVMESMELDSTDTIEFLFQLIHFCQIAYNDNLSLFIYSDG
jgi:hypothetical protein